jgi:environmental stress-induced protein Ves
MHRVLTPADYRHTAWKNGGGRMAEIVVHPPHADLDSFVWRASVADVERDGPFSTFPGVDRTLVLLAGAGFSLTGGDVPLEMRAHYEPVTFAGDVVLECRLNDGAVRDFNLMVRRAAARGELTVVREEAGTIRPARFRLCFVAAGTCECLVAGNVPIVLHDGDALLVDTEEAPPSALHVNPLTPDAVALAASIDLVSTAA